MTPKIVQDYLREVGRQWTGRGIAMELGSWLGATAVALLEGLVEAGYKLPFYAYDRWIANDMEIEKAKHQGIRIKQDQDLMPLFIDNVTQVYKNVIPVKGSIQKTITHYTGEPIEVCIFDAPKRDPVFSATVFALHEYWIPGVTILGLLDYYFYKSKPSKQKLFKAPVRFIEENEGCFTRLAEWPEQCQCVFFRYEKSLKRI